MQDIHDHTDGTFIQNKTRRKRYDEREILIGDFNAFFRVCSLFSEHPKKQTERKRRGPFGWFSGKEEARALTRGETKKEKRERQNSSLEALSR